MNRHKACRIDNFLPDLERVFSVFQAGVEVGSMDGNMHEFTTTNE